MKITRLTDRIINKIYKIDNKTMLVNRDNWEIWKKIKDSWYLEKEVKRKDYQEYIKSSLLMKEKELVEFQLFNFSKVLILTQDEITKEEDRLQAKEDKESLERKSEDEKHQQEAQERGKLNNLIYQLKQELEALDIKSLSPEEVKLYKVYFQNVLSNLRTKEIKDTKTTIEVNKINRLELYKIEIDKYIKEGRFQSINRLCKDLNINRATFYNLKLNEYIKI